MLTALQSTYYCEGKCYFNVLLSFRIRYASFIADIAEKWLALLFYSLEVPNSNLGPQIGYCDGCRALSSSIHATVLQTAATMT
jgi:hypothetical protein